MISYLGSLVQFSPAAGRAGRCRQISLCVRSTHRVPATLGLPPLTGVCVLPVYTAQAPGCSTGSGPCVACGSSFRVLYKSADSVAPAFCAFPGVSGSGSPELDGPGALSPGAARPFPFVAPASISARAVGCQWLVYVLRSCGGCRPSRISGSLWIETGGLFAVWEGMPSLGLSLPLAPPPASFLQRGWAGSSLEFLSPFVLRMAGGVFQPVNFLSCYPTV